MSCSKRYRERTIEYRQAGHSLEATHQVFKVSKSTIQKWEKQLKETGNLEKKDLHRSFRKIDPEKLKAYVAAHPDAYQSEMAETFGCSESGIDTYLYREYGYALRGQQVFGQVRGRKYQRCGIVAAQIGDRILAPFQYSGTMDSRLFTFWFSNHLLLSLEQGTVIGMDNASFHSKERLLFAAQNAGCRLLFLPPYSPELNPIEHFWAWLKRFLRKILPVVSSFDDALSTAFQLW